MADASQRPTPDPDTTELAGTSEAPDGISRRQILRWVGLGGGAVLGGGGALVLWNGASDDSHDHAADDGGSGAEEVSQDPVKLAWYGATCEAPLYAAYEKGFFADEGLTIELVQVGGEVLHDLIGTGKVHGAPAIASQLFKPIEQGVDIKFVGGLHGGCLRLVTRTDGPIKTTQDLRGKTIATDAIGGAAHSFFSTLLAKDGIDPVTDVKWKVFPFDQLGEVVRRGDADAVAAADPFPYALVLDGSGREILSNSHGEHADHFCCAIALNGEFLAEKPATARALVRAWFRGARYVEENITEVARLEVDKKYVALDNPKLIKDLLSNYIWKPSTVGLEAQLSRAVADFKTTGILEKGTDPDQLAKKAFHDLFDGREPAAAPGGRHTTHAHRP